MSLFLALFVALILDWFIGDPASIWKRLPHPVVIIGNGIDFLDRKFNHSSLSGAEARGRGVFVLALLVGLAFAFGTGLAYLFDFLGPVGWVFEVITISIFIAQKSLADHVAAVAQSIRIDGVEGGRRAVSQIVGRNTDVLDEPGICRAAIESLAENFSDGVVAPVFWYLVLGLPGLIAYKAINTADSMIGHKNTRYINFGRATALLDDLVNWPASRASALLIAIAGGVQGGVGLARKILRQSMQDARTHRSPNAGWPEVAMATSLNIALGGPRIYNKENVVEPVLNAGSSLNVSVADIDRSLRIFRNSCIVLWAFVAIITLLSL